ncbi:MAG: hypothetical protein HQK99_08530 [Nitrospirae bacterium]|nr:hypothetical protein [Nitrospirota bacterium]
MISNISTLFQEQLVAQSNQSNAKPANSNPQTTPSFTVNIGNSAYTALQVLKDTNDQSAK